MQSQDNSIVVTTEATNSTPIDLSLSFADNTSVVSKSTTPSVVATSTHKSKIIEADKIIEE